MIDPLARKSLSQDIRRLVTGRMTNDDFDEVYDGTYESEDAAVRWISEFCYGLYSSGLLLPYKLRGRHAVDAETRSTAARAVLFLRSRREYEWPEFPDNSFHALITDLAMIPGIALVLIGIAVALSGAYDVAVSVAIVGLLAVAGCAARASRGRTSVAKQWESFFSSGDYDVWPFLNRDDFDRARRECHLLGK